ncbi:MAG: DUF983 domain-containing protein [Sphingobacteriaceae bacterium]|nr:DUF983 domain-containing protein [Sphingobacteriaceae bacterium]
MIHKLSSIFKNKCPQCGKGMFFIDNNPYKLKLFDKMNKSCEQCGLNFEKEPGFYYGAMYINYGLSVLIGLIIFGIHYYLIGFDPKNYLISFTILLLLLIPVMYRTSRLVWINIFVKHKDK